MNCQDTADSGMEANDSSVLEDLKVNTTDEGNQEVNKPSVTRAGRESKRPRHLVDYYS